ncbi:DUF1217 domain-containing protein [Roseobacter sp.]|uniref:DUF1217 domain-containing protein n=1 Tax=Roseobacter sp. TaxID=1907202 RepID=UPI0032995B37
MNFVPTVFGSGLAGYSLLQTTRAAQQELFEQNTLLVRETTQFAERIESVQTSDELIEDRTLLGVALGAFGLEEDLDNRAFIKQILDSDLDDSTSLANRLADTRYLAFAQTFNFAGSTGAQLPETRTVDDLTLQLESLQTSDDLLSDPSLLRATLEKFDLGGNESNTYFLQQVLESDLSDENSFANRMSDPRLTELAGTFNFFEKEQQRSKLDDIVDVFSGNFDDISSSAELLANDAFLSQAMDVFEIDDVYTTSFLTDVLDSDLNDENSFANSLEDEKFLLLAGAFNFNTPALDEDGNAVVDDDGNTVFQTGKLEAFVEAAASNIRSLATPADFMDAEDLLDATIDLLSLEDTFASKERIERVLNSDPDSPNSLVNSLTSEPYTALFNLFKFEEPVTTRTYPSGFVEQVTQNYLDRQFEIEIGNSDTSMRVALSLERELTDVVESSSSNDGHWFSIMASSSLRLAFEGAFRLPDSFGSIDIDQQLGVMKDRAESFFGTSEVADFLDPDTLNDLRDAYLVSTTSSTGATTSGASIASLILSSF